jgi:hypothetical protein
MLNQDIELNLNSMLINILKKLYYLKNFGEFYVLLGNFIFSTIYYFYNYSFDEFGTPTVTSSGVTWKGKIDFWFV